MTHCKATSWLYYGSHPLFRGSWPDWMEPEPDPAWRYDILRRLGFTHILNLSEKPEHPEHSQGFHVFQLFRHDNLGPRGADYWREAIAFYREVRATEGKLLVHCDGGRSRSPSTCAVLLMSEGMAWEEIMKLVPRVLHPQYIEDGKQYLAEVLAHE